MAERLQTKDLDDLAIFDAVQIAGKHLVEGSVSAANSSVEKVLKSDPRMLKQCKFWACASIRWERLNRPLIALSLF